MICKNKLVLMYMDRGAVMKTKVHSFAFLMEIIIVILFFAASTTVCASFIVKAKNKLVQTTQLQNDMLKAQSIVETLQADYQSNIEEIFGLKKVNENYYQDGNVIVEFEDDFLSGKVIIKSDNQLISELPFVLKGK